VWGRIFETRETNAPISEIEKDLISTGKGRTSCRIQYRQPLRWRVKEIDETAKLIYTTTREGAWTKKQVNLIVSNTDEGKRDAQARVEGNRLIVSNTDELGGWSYKRSSRSSWTWSLYSKKQTNKQTSKQTNKQTNKVLNLITSESWSNLFKFTSRCCIKYKQPVGECSEIKKGVGGEYKDSGYP